MKHRSRYVLALTLVATTLCAQRLFAADGSTRVESKQQSERLAERLVARLTRGLAHAVRQNPLIVRTGITSHHPQPQSVSTQIDAATPALTPAQLPLPPPRL